MTDLNKMADALRSPNKAVRVCATMEAESILRAAGAADVAGLIELAAKAIYDQWNGQLGWVQWVPGGNSTNQDEARRIARAALESALRIAMAQRDTEPLPPFGTKRSAAMALYKPPFKFRMGYIHDAGGHMVADQDGFGEGSKVFDSIAARVRGWGRIGYLPDAEALQDEVGAVIADALTAYWAAAPQPQQEQSK